MRSFSGISVFVLLCVLYGLIRWQSGIYPYEWSHAIFDLLIISGFFWMIEGVAGTEYKDDF